MSVTILLCVFKERDVEQRLSSIFDRFSNQVYPASPTYSKPPTPFPLLYLLSVFLLPVSAHPRPSLGLALMSRFYGVGEQMKSVVVVGVV